MAEVEPFDVLREWRTFTFAGGPAHGKSTPIERCCLHDDWPAVEFAWLTIVDHGSDGTERRLVHLYEKSATVDDRYDYVGVREHGDHFHGRLADG
jgi:hypothetical protein